MQTERKKRMKPDTWMPLYVGDYLKDTMGLDAEGHGAYILLIMAYWSNGGPVSANDDWLRNVCRVKESSWMRIKGLLLPFFSERDGKLVHKRIDEELEEASSLIEARSRAGQAGNAKRWGVNIATGSQPDRNAIADVSQTNPPSPSPSPSPIPSESVAGEREAALPEIPSWEAVKAHAERSGLAEWKARDWFDEMEGVGWRDYRNRQICKWSAVLDRVRTQWEAEGRPMQKPSAKKFTPNGERPKSAFELKTIIQAKDGLAAQIRTRYCTETALEATWSNKEKKDEFFRLKREVKALNEQLSNMA